jgi:DNA-binding phage protein
VIYSVLYEEWVDDPRESPYRQAIMEARTDEALIAALLAAVVAGWTISEVMHWCPLDRAHLYRVIRAAAEPLVDAQR